MKTKTLIELLTLTSSIYVLAKDTELIDRFKEMSEKGKERINKAVSDNLVDEEGNEMEFVDKIIHKTGQLKEELEEKIEELVSQFYKKINVAHVDQINALRTKLEASEASIALLEARINKIEAK